jgi:hypothetical protein
MSVRMSIVYTGRVMLLTPDVLAASPVAVYITFPTLEGCILDEG